MGLPPPRASGGLVSGAPGPRPACVPPCQRGQGAALPQPASQLPPGCCALSSVQEAPTRLSQPQPTGFTSQEALFQALSSRGCLCVPGGGPAHQVPGAASGDRPQPPLLWCLPDTLLPGSQSPLPQYFPSLPGLTALARLPLCQEAASGAQRPPLPGGQCLAAARGPPFRESR